MYSYPNACMLLTHFELQKHLAYKDKIQSYSPTTPGCLKILVTEKAFCPGVNDVSHFFESSP